MEFLIRLQINWSRVCHSPFKSCSFGIDIGFRNLEKFSIAGDGLEIGYFSMMPTNHRKSILDRILNVLGSVVAADEWVAENQTLESSKTSLSAYHEYEIIRRLKCTVEGEDDLQMSWELNFLMQFTFSTRFADSFLLLVYIILNNKSSINYHRRWNIQRNKKVLRN